jgi:acyl-CoA reductase-like NAD-dependent aldehyde dehydrogenase
MIDGGGKVAVGGDYEDSGRYIAPTVLTDVKFSDPVMQEEVRFSNAPACFIS